MKANAARVAALIALGQDPVSNAVTPEQFCMRLDHFVNDNQWRVNLETLTGVPVDNWDEAFAQSYLQTAATCEKPDFFTQTVTRRWPEVLKLQEGRSALIAHAERIAGLEMTLENAAAENWLDLSRATIAQYREAGLEADDVTSILGAELDARRVEAVPLLGAELANGGLDLSLAEMPTYCATERRALPVARYEQATVLPAVEAACETVACICLSRKGGRDHRAP